MKQKYKLKTGSQRTQRKRLRKSERERERLKVWKWIQTNGWGSSGWSHGCGWLTVSPLALHTSDTQRRALWMMKLRIHLWTRAPRRMDTKVSIIAWMKDWISQGWRVFWSNPSEKRLMEDDRQMDEQTDGEWVRVQDVTNRQAGQARGRERRLYSPGDTGLILTYALEWNEDWHDLLIWAVRAHDGHKCSPVTLFPARRMSCHRIGQRSWLIFFFFFHWEWIQTKSLAQTSFSLPACFCCSSLAGVAMKLYITIHFYFLLLFFCFVLFLFKPWAKYWGGGRNSQRFPLMWRLRLAGTRISIIMKRVVLTYAPMPFFNWWQLTKYDEVRSIQLQSLAQAYVGGLHL